MDVDEQGNIILALVGTRVVPDKEYDYYFEREDIDVDTFTVDYKVINGELVKAE